MTLLPLFDPSLACVPLTPDELEARRQVTQKPEPAQGLFSGETRRDLGHQDVIAAAPAVTAWLQTALRDLCRVRQEITSDDLQTAAWNAPQAIRAALVAHPNVVGAVIRGAAAQGWLRDSGSTRKTQRDAGQARRIVTWNVVK